MSVYPGRLEDISIKILSTAKTTFKNVAKAMIVKVLFQSSIIMIGDFLCWFQKSSLFKIVSLKIKIYFTSTKAEDRHSTISFTASSMSRFSLSFNIIGRA